MKIYTYKNAHVVFEKIAYGYAVTLRVGTEVKDKIRCDDYRMARDYCRSFQHIAKNA